MNFVLIYINTLLLLSSLTICLYLIKSAKSKVFFKKNYILIISIIALSVCYKISPQNTFFQGLEYEDSYLANSVSRYLIYNHNSSQISFQVQTCAIGSLVNCEITSTYPSNYMGLPSIIWLVNEIIGYDVMNLSIINLLFSILTAILIFITCNKISGNRSFSYIASLIYICTPILSIFQTTTLFETSSSSLILLSLLLFINYFENSESKKLKLISFIALVIVNILTIHFKRENIIIISFPFLYLFIIYLKNGRIKQLKINQLLPYIIFLIGLVYYYFKVLGINESLLLEKEYALGNAFQFKFFFPLFLMFLKGFTVFKWFYIFILFTLMGLVIIPIQWKKHPLLLFPVFIFLAFILVNSFHHRSYYFVRTWQTTAFDSLRHINMLSPFFSMVTGYGISYCIKIYRHYVRAKFSSWFIGALIFLFALGHLYFLGNSSRNELINIEKKNRIIPILELIDNIEEHPYPKPIIITDQSILLHNFCDPQLQIIELAQLNKFFDTKGIKRLLSENNIYVLWKDYFTESIFRNRYKSSFEVLDSLKLTDVKDGDGYKILRVN